MMRSSFFFWRPTPGNLFIGKDVSHIFYCTPCTFQRDKTVLFEIEQKLSWNDIVQKSPQQISALHWNALLWESLHWADFYISLQRIKRPLQRLLDHAKANIDVIDFRNPQKEVSRQTVQNYQKWRSSVIECTFTFTMLHNHNIYDY